MLFRSVGTWVDDMRPFMVIGEGTWDEASRTMSWITECPSPHGPMRLRETMKALDDRTQVMRVFIPSPAGEFEMITATYRRR